MWIQKLARVLSYCGCPYCKHYHRCTLLSSSGRISLSNWTITTSTGITPLVHSDVHLRRCNTIRPKIRAAVKAAVWHNADLASGFAAFSSRALRRRSPTLSPAGQPSWNVGILYARNEPGCRACPGHAEPRPVRTQGRHGLLAVGDMCRGPRAVGLCKYNMYIYSTGVAQVG